MPEYDDLIAKYILAAALADQGLAQPEKEIPLLSSQSADFYFEPGLGPRNASPVFRWLTFMTPIPCIVEMYAGVPTLVVLMRGPLRKHFEHFQNRCLEAERADQPLPFLQGQWILASGRPEQVFEELGACPVVGAPEGFYRLLVPALRLYVVVLSELPRQRDTLVLRLLGSWRLRQEAIEEIRQIPGDDPDAQALLSLLTSVQAIIDRDKRIPQKEKEEFMLDIKAEIEKFRQGLRSEGRSEGKAESIVKVLKARGIVMNEEAQQRILHCTDSLLLDTWLERAVLAQSADEVLRPVG